MDVAPLRLTAMSSELGSELAELLKAGSSVRAAAAAVSIHYADALRYAHEHDLPVKPRRLDPDKDALIRSLLDTGMGIGKIAETVGVSYSAVYTRARQLQPDRCRTITARNATAMRVAYLKLRLAGITRTSAAASVGICPKTALDYEKGVTKRRGGRTRYLPNGEQAKEYTKLMTRFEQQKLHASTTQIQPGIPEKKADDHLRRIHDRYLSFDQRELIRDLHKSGYSNAEIARELGVHRATIGRELKRNCDQQGRYLPSHASKLAWVRRRRPKVSKIMADRRLREVISQKLVLNWSPEQISGWLKQTFPRRLDWHVCHETIYQALYVQARGGLKRELTAHLRRGRSSRKPHRLADVRQPRYRAGMVSISERPAEAEDRAVPGHWEGDLIIGAGNRSAIATLVERATRFVMLVHLPGRHDAESVAQALSESVCQLPECLRRSLTWDQGSEMARHDLFTICTGCPVYFADPASPWQRGSNENTNGLLRQYFPKGEDLSVYSANRLREVAAELNERPRKTLGWKTPAQALAQLIDSH